MAATSLLMLIDDIATLLDDVAILAKVAAKKTAGVLGDDLALNAQQVTGVKADRELPVVWAVAKGSFINKAILVPAALAISAFAPWAVVPLLMLGGAFLCYEGFEKLLHAFLHRKEADEHHEELVKAVADPAVDIVAFEKKKIKGAIRTDFILSASDFTTQVTVLVGIAVGITVGVYGLVAAIVKLDDLGLWLSQREGAASQAAGAAILRIAPWLMRALSIFGTAAMFLVGGGIITHGISPIHHAIEQLAEQAGGFFGAITPMLLNGIAGIIVGAIVVGVVTLAQKVFGKKTAEA